MTDLITSPALIAGRTLDEERALYALAHARVEDCVFDGPADGESALKEATDIEAVNCDFRLRYPLWHVHGGTMEGCTLTETCRAALWYAADMQIGTSTLGGIKALRECDRMVLRNCTVRSAEFGWLCRDVTILDSCVQGEYPFFMTRGLRFTGGELHGKYSFQYVEDCRIEHADLDTKDAFWHAKGVTVTDSTVKGEYLGWYSEGLTLIRCRIIGTQPLCYCKNLTLIDCTMEGCDLAFENSEVQASIQGSVDSIKSPASGRIEANAVGEIIRDRAPVDGRGCEILIHRKEEA